MHSTHTHTKGRRFPSGRILRIDIEMIESFGGGENIILEEKQNKKLGSFELISSPTKNEKKKKIGCTKKAKK